MPLLCPLRCLSLCDGPWPCAVIRQVTTFPMIRVCVSLFHSFYFIIAVGFLSFDFEAVYQLNGCSEFHCCCLSVPLFCAIAFQFGQSNDHQFSKLTLLPGWCMILLSLSPPHSVFVCYFKRFDYRFLDIDTAY